MGTLEISLLGGFQLRRDGVPLEPIALRAGRSLLAYLLMNQERPHTRDLLAGTFWPDLSNSGARRRLSQALWQVQKSIAAGEDPQHRLLAATGATLAVNPKADFWLDVDEFERSLKKAAPTAAAGGVPDAELLAAARHRVRSWKSIRRRTNCGTRSRDCNRRPWSTCSRSPRNSSRSRIPLSH